MDGARGLLRKSSRDGISYLISLKKAGASTHLMPEYEKEILRLTGTANQNTFVASFKGFRPRNVTGRRIRWRDRRLEVTQEINHRDKTLSVLLNCLIYHS